MEGVNIGESCLLIFIYSHEILFTLSISSDIKITHEKNEEIRKVSEALLSLYT